MTAEQAKQKFEIELGDALDKMNQGVIAPWTARIMILGALNTFKAEVCKKQREICADAFCSEQDPVDYPANQKDHAEAANEIRYNILNAPEPS